MPHMNRWSKFTLIALTSATTAAAVLVFTTCVKPRNTVSFSPHPALAASNSASLKSVADVAEKVLPSVVNISSTRKVKSNIWPFGEQFFRDFFGHRKPPERMQRGLGSGVIIASNGIIVTNNHVVAKADEIRVKLSDGREFDAKVVGTDPKSDVAVIRLVGAKGLTPIVLGDSNRMRLGDFVLAIGNPFGVGQTVTMGIVSAKGRANMGIVQYEDFIQTDAAINPGNSGGALVNMRGELIGINTAILSRSGGYQGISFAIPTSMAKPIIDSLRKVGRVIRGYLGVMIQDVSTDMAKALRLPSKKGVLVSDVVNGSPAKRAGIRRGDFILKLNGKRTESAAQLRNTVAAAGARQKTSLEVWRKGKKFTISITLGELPSKSDPRGKRETKSWGMNLSPMTQIYRRQLEVPARIRYGLVVEAVARGSKAARAGLRRGDVILEANQVIMKSVDSFQRVYKAARRSVVLLVYRRRSTLYILLPK